MIKKTRRLKPALHILKASGKLEKFSAIKYKRSLRRTGLPIKECEKILSVIEPKIKRGISTKDLYKKSYRLIEQKSSLAAAHYSLKRALLELGPAGYYFETFMGKYFEELGFTVKLRKTLKGRCVNHELDVIASSPSSHILMECKFHNRQGKKNDVKIPLYVKARRDDINEGADNQPFTELWLGSNTTFSEDAVKYASCQGIKLLGLNAPSEEPLHEQIRKMKLYPITSLRKLKNIYKEKLIQNNIILCKEIPNNLDLLRQLKMNQHEITMILKDVYSLLDEK